LTSIIRLLVTTVNYLRCNGDKSAAINTTAGQPSNSAAAKPRRRSAGPFPQSVAALGLSVTIYA
jgi:hypothetical protein